MQFSLSSLRRLQNVGPIDLRPLTILVGKNSSGKSTFLRSFPLLRQSITTRTSSPILWFGELVDFGDFENAVSQHNDSSEMTFSFHVDGLITEASTYFTGDAILEQRSELVSAGNLEISIGKDGKGTRVTKIVLEETQNKSKFILIIDKQNVVTSLSIDNVDMSPYIQGYDMRISSGSLLPNLIFAIKSPDAAAIPRTFHASFVTNFVQQAISSILLPLLDRRTTKETLAKLVAPLFSIQSIDKESIFRSASGQTNQSWQKLMRDIHGGKKDSLYSIVRNLLLFARLPSLLRAFCQNINEIFSSTLYIGPARAKSDRYYRYQDLNVSEIDPDGKNFAMFLNSLRSTDLNAFSAWVKSLFGYGVEISRLTGHISIVLQYDNGPVNVVDTGYGVSQILPVLGQIWWANARSNVRRMPARARRSMQIIAIEQPELHLHPAHQALLADAFVGALRQNKDNRLSMIVETHSEVMINRIGDLISSGDITADQVQIVMFEDSKEEEDIAEVSIVKFNEDGHLVNWPYGFFLPTVA